MTDNPKDPKMPGSQSAKRPAATIDLTATEIERRDIPGSDETARAATSGADANAPAESSAKTDESTLENRASATAEATEPPAQPETAAEPPKPAAATRPDPAPRRGSGVGGFVSHLIAGVVGAGVAIFGAEYLANTTGLSLPTYSAAQMDQLARRMSALEQSTKEGNADAATSLVHEQLDAVKAKLDQTVTAVAPLADIATTQKQIADRTTKLEQALTAGGAAADRLAKLEDQFKTLALSGAAGEAGNVGTMAALIAKVDGMGTNLDTHLDEMRKSLQGDLQKQSAHFEDRLSEVDKGMAVETLKASGKTLSDQIVGLRADGDKLRQDIATVVAGNDALRKDLAALQAATDELKTKEQADAATFAKSQQLNDVNTTTTKLQSDVAAIVSRDQAREAGANRILVALQLGNLKRAVDSGGTYAKELTEVKQIAPKGLDLSALEASAEKGLPTDASLASQFKDMTWSILNADNKPSGDGSLLGELWQGARSVVQVRRTDEKAEGTDAILARTEARLQSGDLEGSLHEIGQLKGDAAKVAEPWIAKLNARLAVDRAMTTVEAELAKLMAPAAPAGTN